jgi:hypothetical protein
VGLFFFVYPIFLHSLNGWNYLNDLNISDIGGIHEALVF